MSIDLRLACFLFVSLSYATAVSAQQHSPQTQSGTSTVFLDVVVAPKSGSPVSGLQRLDFTLLDNKVQQTITSFQAVDARQAPMEIVLLIDAVNTNYENLSYERNEVDKFLRADGGNLAQPMSLAVLTDTGIKIQANFSTDGNALSSALDEYIVGLRSITRSSGFWGDSERFQISLEGLHELATREAARPGRKIILWVSPGWPLLSGPNVELDTKDQQQLFANIVNFSNQFLQARITLCSVDPLGNADTNFRTFYWKNFVKGIRKPGEVQAGDLGLSVLAVQSGGLALNSSNDTAGLLQQCIAEEAPYYEISFVPAESEKENEYHQLEVRVAKTGLTARTRQGYYAHPTPATSPAAAGAPPTRAPH